MTSPDNSIRLDVPGAGGPLIPLFAFPVGDIFNCFADDKSNNQFLSTPSLIKIFLEAPSPSASNNLEPKPLLRKGSSIKVIDSFAILSFKESFKKRVLRAIDYPFIADA